MLVYRMVNTDNNAGMSVVCCVFVSLCCYCMGNVMIRSFCDLCAPIYLTLKSQGHNKIVCKPLRVGQVILHLIPEIKFPELISMILIA